MTKLIVKWLHHQPHLQGKRRTLDPPTHNFEYLQMHKLRDSHFFFYLVTLWIAVNTLVDIYMWTSTCLWQIICLLLWKLCGLGFEHLTFSSCLWSRPWDTPQSHFVTSTVIKLWNTTTTTIRQERGQSGSKKC